MESRKISKNCLTAAVTAIVSLGVAAQANAGSIQTANEDITLSGGASAGYYYSTNTGSDNSDNFAVNEFLIDLSAPAKVGGVGFNAGYGNMAQLTVLDGNADNIDTATTLRYASLSFMPVNSLTIEAGVLATNVGYELPNSMSNKNITLGALWNSQPVFYPGARVKYDLNGTLIYAESTTPNAIGAGVIGAAGSVNYAVNYYDQDAGKNILDLILSSSVADIPVGVNFDFITLDDKPAGADDDSGMGLGLFVAPKVGMIDLPVRIEYISDGDSGIYGFDSGYTLTLTPTYNVAKNAFVRAEISMVMADKMFTDEDGNAEDSKTSAAFQMGYRF